MAQKRNKITVHRKGYYRKNGTYVKPTTYRMEDRGKKGRTPKSEKWYAPRTKMNWSKDMAVNTRRNNALRAHGGDALATARALQALANVTTDRETKREAGWDSAYFFGLHQGRHSKSTTSPNPKEVGRSFLLQKHK